MVHPRRNLANRGYIIAALVLIVGVIYIAQLFNLQILSPQYREFAESNAFLRKTLYPARGAIYDRHDKLLVYNSPTYDVMMVVREMMQFDTLDFCKTLNIDIDRFYELNVEMRDRRKNPGYSSYTPQLFKSQLTIEEYALLQEKLYKFPGIYTQSRTQRCYNYPNMGLILGYIAEVDRNRIEAEPYYVRGDYIGKAGLELSYEEELRGVKGVEILLRDAHGRVQGEYDDGKQNRVAVSGKNLTLGVDIELQAYGEQLMHNKVGSIVMIEPATGDILTMVSAPSYDPSLLTGKEFGSNYLTLAKNPYKPLINRPVSGTYPPGSTFKPANGLIFLEEGVITAETRYSCYGGYPPLGGTPRCHDHYSPVAFQFSLATSCNSFYCYGLNSMLSDRTKYSNIADAFDIWRDYMVNQGFGYRLGVDLPSEKRGFIPNSKFYANLLNNERWNAHNIISIAIGQGEILATPVQMANLAATIANRGYFYTPHLVKEIDGGDVKSEYRTRNVTGINPEFYELTVAGMADAVTMGTCWGINLEPLIEVCGKTGTSQNPHGHDHSLFIGFAPRDNPQVAIAVVVENGRFGATNAVPIARLMLQKYLMGAVPESDQWLEQTIINREILPYVYKGNLHLKSGLSKTED